MADHFSQSTQSSDCKNLTNKFPFNLVFFRRRGNTIHHMVIKFYCYFSVVFSSIFLTNRLLFDVSLGNKKNYGFSILLYFPNRATARNSFEKVTINSEFKKPSPYNTLAENIITFLKQ